MRSVSTVRQHARPQLPEKHAAKIKSLQNSRGHNAATPLLESKTATSTSATSKDDLAAGNTRRQRRIADPNTLSLTLNKPQQNNGVTPEQPNDRAE